MKYQVFLNYIRTNSGLQTCYYRTKNLQNQWIYYCITKTKDGVIFYRTSKDGEPSYALELDNQHSDATIYPQLPKGHSDTDNAIKEYLTEIHPYYYERYGRGLTAKDNEPKVIK